MIKAVIFDLDGTLLDTLEDIQSACNKIMEEYGFDTFTKEEIQSKVGNGNRKLIERCLPEDRKYLLDEAVSKFYKYYGECYKEKTVPYKGISELLNVLETKGIKISCNTNKFNIFCEELLKDKFPHINFFRIIGSRDNIPNKPDPYSCNEIIEDLKVNKDEVLFIGDSDVDIKTGINAGIKTVWVSWGFRGEEVIKDLNPDYKIDDARELIRIIEGNKPRVVSPITK